MVIRILLIILLCSNLFGQLKHLGRDGFGNSIRLIGSDGLGGETDAPSYPSYVATPDYIFDYQDLVDGAVSSWLNQQDTLTLRQSTGDKQPVKSSNGVTFDVTDVLYASMPYISDGITIMLQMTIPDTNYISSQRICGYRVSTPSIRILTLQMATNAITTYRKLGSSYYDGTGYTHRTFLTNLGNTNLSEGIYALVADVTNKQSLIINDVTGVNQGAPYSTTQNFVAFGLGDVEASGGMNGGVIKRVLVYSRKLTIEELTENYNALIARP